MSFISVPIPIPMDQAVQTVMSIYRVIATISHVCPFVFQGDKMVSGVWAVAGPGTLPRRSHRPFPIILSYLQHQPIERQLVSRWYCNKRCAI